MKPGGNGLRLDDAPPGWTCALEEGSGVCFHRCVCVCASVLLFQWRLDLVEGMWWWIKGGGKKSRLGRLSFLFCVALYEHCYDVQKKNQSGNKSLYTHEEDSVCFYCSLQTTSVCLLSSNQLVGGQYCTATPTWVVYGKTSSYWWCSSHWLWWKLHWWLSKSRYKRNNVLV